LASAAWNAAEASPSAAATDGAYATVSKEENVRKIIQRETDLARRDAIEDYVVEEQGDRVLKTFKTQADADHLGKGQGHSPHLARARRLNDKKIPNHLAGGLAEREISPMLSDALSREKLEGWKRRSRATL
jgi:hypothetical protein